MTNHDTFPRGDDLQSISSCSMDAFFDEIFNDTSHACTHTHTCNPAGPDLPHHTHTCFHVHTKILSSSAPATTVSDAADQTAESAGTGPAAAANTSPCPKKRPCGNREAVRKYRQKKKAQAASLEDDNRLLREENRRLRRMLQDTSALEAENVNLKLLLVDVRSRIDGALGSFPYQRTAAKGNMEFTRGVVSPHTDMVANGGTQVMNSCGVISCDDRNYCALPVSNGKADGGTGEIVNVPSQGFGACELGTGPCFGYTNRDFV